MTKILKTITDPSKFAEALNFNLYPVLRVDVSKTGAYGIEAVPFRVATGDCNSFNGLAEIRRLKLQIFSDCKIPTFQEAACVLSSSRGYYDYSEVAIHASSPVIEIKLTATPFILVLDNPETCQLAVLELHFAKAPLTNSYYIEEFQLSTRVEATAEFAEVLESVNAYNKLIDIEKWICKK